MKNKKEIVVAVSGGFDPIHIGHVRLFNEAKALGDKLVVILNNDNWLKKKKGYAFMNENERKEIIEALGSVDEVFITKHSKNTLDMSVCDALRVVRPNIFANGGDRKKDNIPEVAVCDEIDAKMVFGIGYGGKVQSSSWLLKANAKNETINKNTKSVFKPKPGQIDYTKARWAPVINCVLKYKDKILVVQRSKELNFYPGYWNGISGFLDDKKNLEEKVFTEIKEELGIFRNDIKRIRLGEIFDQEEFKYKKTWIVHPILVEVKTDKIKLDWEAKNYKWIKIQETKKLKLLPGFNEVLKKLWKTKQEK